MKSFGKWPNLFTSDFTNKQKEKRRKEKKRKRRKKEEKEKKKKKKGEEEKKLFFSLSVVLNFLQPVHLITVDVNDEELQ